MKTFFVKMIFHKKNKILKEFKIFLFYIIGAVSLLLLTYLVIATGAKDPTPILPPLCEKYLTEDKLDSAIVTIVNDQAKGTLLVKTQSQQCHKVSPLKIKISAW